MEKILLCLLSDQHIPNLLSIHHFKPDRLVLIESPAMKKRNVAAHFLAALKFGGLDYETRADIEPLLAEDSLNAVRTTLRQAYGKHPSGDWIANLTGGTKPMSIAAYEFFKALNGRLVYTSIARPDKLIEVNTEQTEDCRYRLTIKEFLAGYGFESRKNHLKIKQAEDRARPMWECSRILAEQPSAGDLLALPGKDPEETRKNWKKARDKGWDLESGQLLSPSLEAARALASAFALEQNAGGSLVGQLSQHQVQFLTGGWLEVFFWGLLDKHAASLGLWDVRLGLEVSRLGDTSGNDFDVAFMHDYALKTIECKSGAQEHDAGGDVLYKVEALTRQFRALRVKSYLATTGSNVLDRDGHIKPAIDNRAKIYDCRILTTEDIRDLALKADDPDLVKAKLFRPAEKP